MKNKHYTYQVKVNTTGKNENEWKEYVYLADSTPVLLL